jgi:hypothetical protein
MTSKATCGRSATTALSSSDVTERLAMLFVTGSTGTTRDDRPVARGVTALYLHPRAAGLAAGELLALARQRGCSG